MSHKIIYFKLSFDSQVFSGYRDFSDGSRFSSRDFAVKVVESMNEYFLSSDCRFLNSSMNRKVIHSYKIDDKFTYSYRHVVVDYNGFPQIICFGIERSFINLI